MSFAKPWEQTSIDRDMDRARTSTRDHHSVGVTAQPKKRINIRQKGANGERQLATQLNAIVNELLVKHGIPVPDKPVIQRNQNQTAVGGNDLSNVFGLGIEVKRQENLQIEQWWRQCTEAAARNNEFPVLIYRQNNQAWRVVVMMWVQLPAVGGRPTASSVRAEMKWEAFLAWFRTWVDYKLLDGERPQV
jgi:hypothetical protein